jgi:hypothetical protein
MEVKESMYATDCESFKLGDIAEVVNSGESYPNYGIWADRYSIDNFVSYSPVKNGMRGKITHIGPELLPSGGKTILAVLVKNRTILISTLGVKCINPKDKSKNCLIGKIFETTCNTKIRRVVTAKEDDGKYRLEPIDSRDNVICRTAQYLLSCRFKELPSNKKPLTDLDLWAEYFDSDKTYTRKGAVFKIVVSKSNFYTKKFITIANDHEGSQYNQRQIVQYVKEGIWKPYYDGTELLGKKIRNISNGRIADVTKVTSGVSVTYKWEGVYNDFTRPLEKMQELFDSDKWEIIKPTSNCFNEHTDTKTRLNSQTTECLIENKHLKTAKPLQNLKENRQWQHYNAHIENYSTQLEEETVMSYESTFTTTVKTKPYQVIPAYAVFYGKKVKDMDESDLFSTLKIIENEQKTLESLNTGDDCDRVTKQLKVLKQARKHVYAALDSLPSENDNES